MAAGVRDFVERRTVPIDWLEIGLWRRHLHEVERGAVISLRAADPEIDARRPDQRLDPRLDQTWRRRRRDGRDLVGKAVALIGIEDGKAFEERDRARCFTGLGSATPFVVGGEAIGVDDGRAALTLADICRRARGPGGM